MLKLWVELNPKSASWNSLTTAVRKMPQHQSLAEDIQENFLEQGKLLVEYSTVFTVQCSLNNKCCPTCRINFGMLYLWQFLQWCDVSRVGIF